jgi:hypothetical protein
MKILSTTLHKPIAFVFSLFFVLSIHSVFAQTAITPGWNLVGNGYGNPIAISNVLSNKSQVISVWKWDNSKSSWAFYSPSYNTFSDLTTYASGQGYQVLSTVNPGEGFWINAAQAFTLAAGTGAVYNSSNFNFSSSTAMALGWNLISIGDTITPSQFNANIGSNKDTTGHTINFTSLWAWDNINSKWFFYAPSLEAAGTLTQFATTNGYEDFTASGKSLGLGLGFWVNNPNSSSYSVTNNNSVAVTSAVITVGM